MVTPGPHPASRQLATPGSEIDSVEHPLGGLFPDLGLGSQPLVFGFVVPPSE